MAIQQIETIISLSDFSPTKVEDNWCTCDGVEFKELAIDEKSLRLLNAERGKLALFLLVIYERLYAILDN